MRLSYLLALSVFFVACSSSQKAGTTAGAATSGKWRLIFQDEFNASGSFDTTKWSFCKRGNPAWAKYLTQSGDYASLNGSNLLLRMDKKISKATMCRIIPAAFKQKESSVFYMVRWR